MRATWLQGGLAFVLALLLATASALARDGDAGDGPFVRSVPGTSAEIWAVGDGADGSATSAAVVDRIVGSDPDRFIYLGDVYETGTAADFAANYAPTWGHLAPITAPTLGNHEAANAASGYDPYWTGIHGKAPPDFYAFRAGGWQLLGLNSEIAPERATAQLRWLERKTARGGSCRIAFWHRPRHSAGMHGSAPDLQPLWDRLRGRARMVLSGHEHNMQRFAARGGIVQFISGAGGRANYGVDRAHPALRFADDTADGALRLRLRPRVARADFVSAAGEVLDRSVARCRR